MTERRSPDRLDDRELEIEQKENAAGGYIVVVRHRRYRRFATASHQNAETAKRLASRELAKVIAELKRRRG